MSPRGRHIAPAVAAHAMMLAMVERAIAGAAVVLLPVLLRLLPLRTTLELCTRWPRHAGPRADPDVLAFRVARLMHRGRGPWAPTCLTRAVVLYAMLHQHGHPACLHVGAAGRAGDFLAHAWVTVDGRPLRDPAPTIARFRALLTHGQAAR